MRKFREGTFKENGITSPYGVHRKTQTGKIPDKGLGAPINDLYGPHLYFGGMVQDDEEDEDDEDDE